MRRLICWLKGHKWTPVRVYSVESKEPVYFEEAREWADKMYVGHKIAITYLTRSGRIIEEIVPMMAARIIASRGYIAGRSAKEIKKGTKNKRSRD